MSKIPRASICITILGDEDYCVLMSRPGGPEAFGVFAAMLILGRERLQQDKARQLPGTDALRFDNRTNHLLTMTRLPAPKLDAALATLADVAAETGGEPWMYLDDAGRLVIRSFFKFNTSTGWGGARAGSGRHAKDQAEPGKNHLDSGSGIKSDHLDSGVEIKMNHLDSRSESSRFPSGSGSGSGSGVNPPLPPPAGVGDGGGTTQPFPTPARIEPAPLPTIPAAPPVTGPIRPAPAIPNTPDPTVLANLEAIARSSLGDRGAIEDYPMKIDGWLRSYPADWVRDAILCTAARDGCRPGGLAQYTAACLRRWHPNGPPRGEVESARRKADKTPAPVYKVFKDDGLFADTDREVLRRRREAKQA